MGKCGHLVNVNSGSRKNVVFSHVYSYIREKAMYKKNMNYHFSAKKFSELMNKIRSHPLMKLTSEGGAVECKIIRSRLGIPLRVISAKFLTNTEFYSYRYQNILTN